MDSWERLLHSSTSLLFQDYPLWDRDKIKHATQILHWLVHSFTVRDRAESEAIHERKGNEMCNPECRKRVALLLLANWVIRAIEREMKSKRDADKNFSGESWISWNCTKETTVREKEWNMKRSDSWGWEREEISRERGTALTFYPPVFISGWKGTRAEDEKIERPWHGLIL